MLNSRGCQDDKKYQERPPRVRHKLFISVPKNRAVRLNNVPFSRRPDAPVGLIGRSLSVRSLRAKPTDERHVSLYKYYALIFNGCEVSQCAVKVVTGHA
jgi:hypothetical protein